MQEFWLRRLIGTILRVMGKTYHPYVPEQDLLLPPSVLVAR
jgi:hypothetical protein